MSGCPTTMSGCIVFLPQHACQHSGSRVSSCLRIFTATRPCGVSLFRPCFDLFTQILQSAVQRHQAYATHSKRGRICSRFRSQARACQWQEQDVIIISFCCALQTKSPHKEPQTIPVVFIFQCLCLWVTSFLIRKLCWILCERWNFKAFSIKLEHQQSFACPQSGGSTHHFQQPSRHVEQLSKELRKHARLGALTTDTLVCFVWLPAPYKVNLFNSGTRDTIGLCMSSCEWILHGEKWHISIHFRSFQPADLSKEVWWRTVGKTVADQWVSQLIQKWHDDLLYSILFSGIWRSMGK